MSEDFMMHTYEKFAAHINEETERARQEGPAWIDDPTVTTVGCVDGLTKKGSVNPPGGLIFLFKEHGERAEGSLLEHFIRVRAEQGVIDGELMAHENCGYMRVVLGLDKLESHQNMIGQARNYLEQLNQQYSTNFIMITERQGSAAPYMKIK